MKKVEMNEIPQLLESEKITKEEAAKWIWTNVYFSPEKYNLKELDEDSLSDFLLQYRHRFAHLIEMYDKNRADFTTFIRSCMMQFKNTWKRKSAKSWAEAKSLEQMLENTALSIADYESDPALILEEDEEEMLNVKKDAKEVRETALILALKACNDIDDDSIKKLSKFIRKSEVEIHELISKLRGTMQKKEQIQNLMIRRRDKSFFKKRKFDIELSQLEKGCGEYTKVKKLYESQLKNWKKSNETLTHRYVMSPQNQEIAKIMGISVRKVYYCISHAKDEEKMKIFQQVFKESMPEPEQ
ncbi:MAG: hypothetical protein IKP49_03245 [Treponema sp.]|nr:hypothetical protein [Treponema sp.]MBR6913549.1 hypothetical protein [Treponema sp.]